MIKPGANRFNYLGSAVFAFLFFLLIYGFSGNLGKTAVFESPYKFAFELQSHTTAIVVEIQEVHFSNHFITIIDKSNFKLFNEGSDLISYNTINHQLFRFLQQTELLIKPVINQRFYNQYHYIDADDLPDLS